MQSIQLKQVLCNCHAVSSKGNTIESKQNHFQIVIPFKTKQDQNQSTNYRDRCTLFHFLPQSRVDRIVMNSNEIISYQLKSI